MFPVLEFDDHHKNECYRSSQKGLISRFKGMAESLIICCKGGAVLEPGGWL